MKMRFINERPWSASIAWVAQEALACCLFETDAEEDSRETTRARVGEAHSPEKSGACLGGKKSIDRSDEDTAAFPCIIAGRVLALVRCKACPRLCNF